MDSKAIKIKVFDLTKLKSLNEIFMVRGVMMLSNLYIDSLSVTTQMDDFECRLCAQTP